jgi:hypothetical protein
MKKKTFIDSRKFSTPSIFVFQNFPATHQISRQNVFIFEFLRSAEVATAAVTAVASATVTSAAEASVASAAITAASEAVGFSLGLGGAGEESHDGHDDHEQRPQQFHSESGQILQICFVFQGLPQ